MEGESKEITKMATHGETKTCKTKQSEGRRLRTEQKRIAMLNLTSKSWRREYNGTEAIFKDIKMSKSFPHLRKGQATEIR